MTGVLLALAAGALSLPAAASAPAASRPAGRDELYAVIQRTTGGIPHITAHNWTSLGYGYGYAFAQDDLCTMAEDYVTVEAQRSRYFGPSGTYVQRGNGVTVTNLDSDIFFQQIIDSHVVQQLVAQPPPNGPEPQVKQLVDGYVLGYDRYLADVGGSAGVPDPTCRGKPWVRPITVLDAYLRFYQLVLLAGDDVVMSGIAEAAPPLGPAAAGPGDPAVPDPQATARLLAVRWQRDFGSIGSNAVAIGSAGTRDHTHGLLLGNPHFPWIGPERFYQAQLTIPGQIDVSGASLYGVPLVLIGHTATMAWSHTVSTAYRFTPYQLTLVPGRPTEYLLDGRPVAMIPRPVTVQVRQSDGALTPYSHTVWWTRYGPVFDSIEGIPLPWTATTAFAIRDANASNFRVFNHFIDVDRAGSTLQVLQILKKYQGIPWVNTIVADKSGQVLYADIGAIPNVSNAEAKRCDTALGAATFADLGLPILDGSRTSCDWATDKDAAVPGIFGPSHEPYLLRRDYVTNSNDSYWLANPQHPLVGYARIIGTEGTPRTLRTRIGLIEVQARIDGTDGSGPPGFTVDDMADLDLNDLEYAAVLTRSGLVQMCDQFAAAGGYAPTTSGPPVPLGDACQVLAAWNLREDVNSRGAVLFRTFWSYANGAEPSPYSHPFSASDPVHTPYGLNTDNPTVRTALGNAIANLDQAGIPLDATVGSVQYVVVNGRRYPIPGGPGDPDGIFNAIYLNEYPGDPLHSPDEGSSYIQVITWNGGSCPVGVTILTYSESANPLSPYHADQTVLFSGKRWLPDEFCQRAIDADPNLRTTVLTGPAD